MISNSSITIIKTYIQYIYQNQEPLQWLFFYEHLSIIKLFLELKNLFLLRYMDMFYVYMCHNFNDMQIYI